MSRDLQILSLNNCFDKLVIELIYLLDLYFGGKYSITCLPQYLDIVKDLRLGNIREWNQQTLTANSNPQFFFN